MLVFTSIVLWDKDEVIRFRGEKVKSEGRVRQNQLELDIEFQPSGWRHGFVWTKCGKYTMLKKLIVSPALLIPKAFSDGLWQICPNIRGPEK